MEEVEGKTGGSLGDGEVAGCSKSPPPSLEVREAGDEDVNAGNKFLHIFHFDLVVERTLSYLNFEDMKALNETSKEILDAVRNTTQFSKRAKLKICEEIIQNGFLKECTIPWRHVTFDLDLLVPDEAVDLLGEVLEGTESVYLKSGHRLDDGGVACRLEKVLTRTKNLKTLGLDINIMNFNVFSNVGIQLVMSNLQCLEIRNFNNPSIRYYRDIDLYKDIAFSHNLLQLSTVPLNLKSLLLGKEYGYYLGSESEFIPRIVESSKNTLQDLELHYEVWKLEEMKRIRCPNLKRLTLSTIGYECYRDGDGEVVETFLKNQPPLEELDISFIRGFPARIFLTMQGMLMKMKKLHLKAPRFTFPGKFAKIGNWQLADWQFLENMTELKDFALRKPASGVWYGDEFYNYGAGETILIKLPVTTEKISLQDVPFRGNDNIGNLLARFENLKELDLLDCTGSVTNDVLQSIISNCRKLVSLTFSDLDDQLTDYGISGVHPREEGRKTDSEGDKPESKNEKTGRSLEELTGLIHLKIRDCHRLHYETLLHVVKFKFLRSFDYYEEVSLPKEFLYQIVRQNPCLERITLHMASEDEDHDSEYLNELKKEVKQINSRVHLFKLHEDPNWDDNDSDNDLDDLITERWDMTSE